MKFKQRPKTKEKNNMQLKKKIQIRTVRKSENLFQKNKHSILQIKVFAKTQIKAFYNIFSLVMFIY